MAFLCNRIVFLNAYEKDEHIVILTSLGILVVTDRIVQTAISNVMEPIFEKTFAEQSYGFRPGRGCKDALRRLEELLKNGHP